MAINFFGLTEQVKLEKEFKATCWHESGHAAICPDALESIVVKKSKKLNFIDGGADIDLSKVPEGGVANVSLAGCLAEAKRAAVLEFGAVRFERDN